MPGRKVNHKRKRCAPACRQQCTPLLLFERITMDHVGKTGLMLSGWDVPRTEPVVRSRRFYAPPPLPSPGETAVSPPPRRRSVSHGPPHHRPLALRFHSPFGTARLRSTRPDSDSASSSEPFASTTERNPPLPTTATACRSDLAIRRALCVHGRKIEEYFDYIRILYSFHSFLSFRSSRGVSSVNYFKEYRKFGYRNIEANFFFTFRLLSSNSNRMLNVFNLIGFEYQTYTKEKKKNTRALLRVNTRFSIYVASTT